MKWTLIVKDPPLWEARPPGFLLRVYFGNGRWYGQWGQSGIRGFKGLPESDNSARPRTEADAKARTEVLFEAWRCRMGLPFTPERPVVDAEARRGA